MAVAGGLTAGLIRYCMRHPTRVLFILLLLLLVIASRFLYSSVPDQQHAHELNLMAGSLSQQHGHKNVRKQPYEPQPKKQTRTGIPVDKNTLEQTAKVDNTFKVKEKERDLSQKANEGIDNSKTNGAIIIEGSDEKSENDLSRRKIPDVDRLRESAGNLLPFEAAAEDKHDEEFTERKLTRERDNRNRDAQRDSLPAVKRNGNRKLSRQKNVPQQEYNILMVFAKVGQTSPLAKRFKRCVLSICEHSTVNLTFHLITDKVGKLTTENTFNQAAKVCKSGLNVVYYDLVEVAKKVRPITKEIQVRNWH